MLDSIIIYNLCFQTIPTGLLEQQDDVQQQQDEDVNSEASTEPPEQETVEDRQAQILRTQIEIEDQFKLVDGKWVDVETGSTLSPDTCTSEDAREYDRILFPEDYPEVQETKENEDAEVITCWSWDIVVWIKGLIII